MPMFRKILVANRGEIAARIFAACRQLRVSSVAIVSDSEQGAAWSSLADEYVHLPGASASESYLDQAAIIQAAKDMAAEAIHPGYGFLSENGEFAQACADAGIIFIGPSARAIQQMGDKAAAREIARHAGAPVIPGVDGQGKSIKALQKEAEKIGYPVLIKARAGGGGKGMRVAGSATELAEAVPTARSEAQSAFGNGEILLERFFSHIRHIEVQLLGDHAGNLLHLFERECSIQRRHQKIIEETPAPNLEPSVRARICQAAAALGRAVGYVNAGTVEFIVDEHGDFYFLEMNTRLQVEHPITEATTGLDLAAWQIRIAAGERLPFNQTDIIRQGHSIECRIYAEDPADNFMPSIGKVERCIFPRMAGVRVDAGIVGGSSVTPYFDPMLAKIISWGENRYESRRKMIAALRETIILGVVTNIPFLLDILAHPDFRDGDTPTNFLEKQMPAWQPQSLNQVDLNLAMAGIELFQKRRASRHSEDKHTHQNPNPWQQIGNWRNLA